MGIIWGKLKFGKNLERTLFELEEGEHCYAEPKELEFDYDLNAYLNLNGELIPKKYGHETGMISVKKIGPNKEDYLVNISKVLTYVWTKTNNPFEEFLDEDDEIDNKDSSWKEKSSPKKRDSMIIKLNYQHEETIKKSIQEQYKEAIENENYELASKIRDKIKK